MAGVTAQGRETQDTLARVDREVQGLWARVGNVEEYLGVNVANHIKHLQVRAALGVVQGALALRLYDNDLELSSLIMNAVCAYSMEIQGYKLQLWVWCYNPPVKQVSIFRYLSCAYNNYFCCNYFSRNYALPLKLPTTAIFVKAVLEKDQTNTPHFFFRF